MARMQKFLFLVLTLFINLPTQAQLTFGVIFYDPPLVFSATQGFNIDLAKKVCEGLKETCRFRNREWNQLFTALDKGDINVLVGAYITPERAEKYFFSKPYMQSKGRFITLASSGYTTTDQLKGKKVGIIQEEQYSGVFHGYVHLNYTDQFQLIDYKDLSSLLDALSKKNIAAAVVHNNAVNYWLINSSDKLTTIGPAFDIGEGIGMLSLPTNKALIDAINQQLQQMKTNGTYQQIYDNYF